MLLEKNKFYIDMEEINGKFKYSVLLIINISGNNVML
jgi:hypothetical protein